MQALTRVDLGGLKVFSTGKVRTLYDLGDKLLVVASDRISAFDQVIPSGIPDKGKILTAVSSFWFRTLEKVSRHHLITDDVAGFPAEISDYQDILRHRSMLVWKARRIDVECIVRGYLAGSAWKEYSQEGAVGDYRLPRGLRPNAKLQPPLFTPSTKSEEGHDRNISFAQMCELVGSEPAGHIMARSLSLFAEASNFARTRDITLVDTKFEFGYLRDDIVLIDEALTPDSSRFLVREKPAGVTVNADKQFIRDYLEATGWDKDPPPPTLPQEVVSECRRRYLLLYRKLTGEDPPWLK
jgi:phosphoribosylaminoimidazole-succinocarboxamide synthase